MSSDRILSLKKLAGIVIVLALVGIGLSAYFFGVNLFGTGNNVGTTSFVFSGSQTVGSWTSLRGVNYAWGPLGIQCCANSPNIDFPIMHGLGFNLIRVPISWNTYEQNTTTYTGYLEQVANEADSLGMHVVYDAHTESGNEEPGSFFPSSLATKYANSTIFFLNWWEGNVEYNGTSGWKALWNDFWLPVINVVNSHSSTLGYEIENEPQPDGAPFSDLQAYNQYMADRMQAISNKYIVFMGPNVGLVPSSDIQLAPKNITNLVMDAHCYIGTPGQPDSCSENGGMDTNLANVAGVGRTLGIRVWIGEWAVCSPGGCIVSQSQATSIISEYVSEFQKYGFANSYWAWKCDKDPATVGQTDLLTAYPGCNTYWLDTLVSQASG